MADFEEFSKHPFVCGLAYHTHKFTSPSKLIDVLVRWIKKKKDLVPVVGPEFFRLNVILKCDEFVKLWLYFIAGAVREEREGGEREEGKRGEGGKSENE